MPVRNSLSGMSAISIPRIADLAKVAYSFIHFAGLIFILLNKHLVLADALFT